MRAEKVAQRVEEALSQKNVDLSEAVTYDDFVSLLDQHSVSVEWDGWSVADIHRVVGFCSCRTQSANSGTSDE